MSYFISEGFMKIGAFLLSAAQFVAAPLCGAASLAGVPQRITVQPNRQYQVLENFGTSGAWWAQHVDCDETADEIARLLYCQDTGLGLNLYRFNVGAGEYDNPNSRVAGGHWNLRRTQSFYVLGEETGEYEFDFTRDANARRMLDLAIEYGATQVILFAKSPHFSMTSSGHASGALTSPASNHPPETYQAYVDYFLHIADWFVEQGYPVFGISPINEPQWGWGGDWVSQEGCHYKPEEVVALMELFAVTMKERGVEYELLGFESGDMSNAYTDYTDAYLGNKIIRDYANYLSGHSYWMDNDIFKKWWAGKRMARLYPDIKFEMTEWCELGVSTDSPIFDSGIYQANIMIQDLTLLNAVSWQSWVALNEDGVLNLLGDHGRTPDYENGVLTKYNRYWAFMHFSRFIQPGAQRVRIRDAFGPGSQLAHVAFTQGNETVLVIVNNAVKPQDIRLSGSYNAMQWYVTDGQRECEQAYSGAFEARQTLPARSINTFVLTER